MIHVHESFQGGVDRLWTVLFAGVPPYLRGAMRRIDDRGIEFHTVPDTSVPSGVDLSWWNYVEFASHVDEWTVTTGELEVRPNSQSVIHPDTPRGVVGCMIPGVGRSDTLNSNAYAQVCPHQAWALPAGGSRRNVSTLVVDGRHFGVIVVSNRGHGHLPSGAIPGPLTDAYFVYMFFHEVTLHAGTISYYLSGNPGTPIDHPGVDPIDRQLQTVIHQPVCAFRVV